MERHKIGTQAGGVAGMSYCCELLSVGIDPKSSYAEYSDIPGQDLNGVPIEAGLPKATWEWDAMPQSDFQMLLDFIGTATYADVYIRTRKNSGASGLDFGTFLCVMTRPQYRSRLGLVVKGVTVEFVALEEV